MTTPQKTEDDLVIRALRHDAMELVQSIVDCLDGKECQMASDVARYVRQLDALNAVLKYYGGEVVEVPAAWPSRVQ